MCEANILCQSSSVRSAVPSSSTSPVVSRVRAMPALLTRTSMVPNAAMKSANIFFTAALLETSATKGRATPPARSISVATFCGDSGRTSLTPTFAPSRANSRPISRPRPEPPPVTNTILSFNRIVRPHYRLGAGVLHFSGGAPPAPLMCTALFLGLSELALPVEPAGFRACGFGFLYHALLLVEHAQVCKPKEIFGLDLHVTLRHFDGGIEIAFGLMAHREAGEGIAASRIEFERLPAKRDGVIVITVGVLIDRFVAQILSLCICIFVLGHTFPPGRFP